MTKPVKKSIALAADAPTPEELQRWVAVGRGDKSTFAKPRKGAKTLRQLHDALGASHGQRTIKLDPDVAVYFRDDKAVNEVLRHAMGIMKMKLGAKRRKTA